MASTEFIGVVASLVALVVAVAILVGLKKYFGSIDATVFVALLILPLVVYAVGSERIKQFTAPGGWGATFRDTAEAVVQTSGIVENAEQLQSVEKRGLGSLGEFVETLDRNLPNAMVLRVGRQGYYQAKAIASYLQTLTAVGPATYVIFVDNDTGKFIASANGAQVLALVESGGGITREFMSELERGGENALQSYTFLVRSALDPGDTNKTALRKFLESNAQALVVVSVDGRKPTGVVDRNRLMTKLMLELAGDEGK